MRAPSRLNTGGSGKTRAERERTKSIRDAGAAPMTEASPRRDLLLAPADPAALEALGRLDRDARWLARALSAAPDFVQARINLAADATSRGAGALAARLLRGALALAPAEVAAWFNLGVASDARVAASPVLAVPAYRRALVLDPGALDAATNLSQLLAPQAPSLAEVPLKRSIALFPDQAPALNALALLLRSGADNDGAERWLARASALLPDSAPLASNLLLQLAYSGIAPQTLLRRHLDWARRYAKPAASPPRRDHDPGHWRDPEKRLRVGYVSADLARHPVGFFLLPALAHRDRAQVETVCYSGGGAGDRMTERLKTLADRWVETARLDDGALEARIRADKVDILVDLSGHTGAHRLLVFAAKPAPLQASWLGYPATTGLAQIDYLIADRRQIGPEDERFYAERILRLEPGYLAYVPPEDAPEVTPLPALERGSITFGSLNNLAKLNPETLALWAKVLDAVPGSRLLLAWASLGDAGVRQRLGAMAAASGIAPERLLLRPGGDAAAFLSRYGEIDIALDPFPYSGGLTTLEALWMGVPVLTWPGERFASRHSASHLFQAGLEDWIAASPADYVERARRAAADLPALARARATMRQRLSASPLLDARGFAIRLDALYRRIWREWCAGMSGTRA
jgi:tetratricopeptide (TPR) repeat protein